MMHNTKLVELFRLLTPREVTKFRDYSRFYHPRNKSALKLIDYVASLHPEKLTEAHLSQTRVRRALEEKSWSVISKKSSEVYRWLEGFLLIEKIQQADSNPQRELLLAEIFAERGTLKLFRQKVEKAEKKSSAGSFGNNWDALNYLRMLDLQYFSVLDHATKESKEGLQTLRKMRGQVRAFYLTMSLKYQAEWRNRASILQEGVEEEDSSHSNSLLKRSFELADGMAAHPDERGHYQAIKRFLQHNQAALDPEVQFILRGYAINYLSRRIREGKKDFERELFEEWYKRESFNDILAHHNLLTPTLVVNTVNLAVQLGYLHEAEAFMAKYLPELPSAEQGPVGLICKAILAYEGQQFAEVVSLLSQRKGVPPRLEVRMRAVLLLAQVQAGYEERMLERNCKQFQSYLRGHKELGEVTRMGFRNLARLLNRIVTGHSQKVLYEEVVKTQPLYCKRWLLQILTKEGRVK